MKWISVKDELPKETQIVVIGYIGANFKPPELKDIYEIASYMCGKWWAWNNERLNAPDYWIPIVPLPRDGD